MIADTVSITAVLVFLWQVFFSGVFCDTGKNKWQYCIVGAGPSGLQMAYFLAQANRDYVIFEKNDRAGSFYELYPRHRQLISINKRWTGRKNREFNLRHDWNSLLTTDFSHMFGKYSKEYFPHADDMLKYLKDYAEKFHLNVRYNTDVSDIRYHRTQTSENHCRFTMLLNNKEPVCCKTTIVATGLSAPTRLNIAGNQYIEYYDSVSVDPNDFEGQSVLIIGRGNSALELAKSIYGRTSFVHLLGRERLRFSWDTHYVGDIRGVNNEVVDAYMLKSLDGFLEMDLKTVRIVKRSSDGKLMLANRNGQKSADNSPTREGYDRIIACTGFVWNSSIFNNSIVIKPGLSPSGRPLEKYPWISHDFENGDYPGLHFIGTISHSLDHRKSAGGFIHGFRYTVRALHHLLELSNHRITWPSLEQDTDKLTDVLVKRMNEASGLYQMFSNLADLVIVNHATNSFVYLEEFPVNLINDLEGYTGHYFDSTINSLFVMDFEYGKNISKINYDRFRVKRAIVKPQFAHLSNFLHPIVYFYDHRLPTAIDFKYKVSDDVVPSPDDVHHVLEDFTTIFDSRIDHRLPLQRFIESKLNRNHNLKNFRKHALY